MSLPAIKKFDEVLQGFSEAEQLNLIAYVAAKLKKGHRRRRPQDLAGFLVGKVDRDLDIDFVLREARSEWLKGWNGNENG